MIPSHIIDTCTINANETSNLNEIFSDLVCILHCMSTHPRPLHVVIYVFSMIRIASSELFNENKCSGGRNSLFWHSCVPQPELHLKRHLYYCQIALPFWNYLFKVSSNFKKLRYIHISFSLKLLMSTLDTFHH